MVDVVWKKGLDACQICRFVTRSSSHEKRNRPSQRADSNLYHEGCMSTNWILSRGELWYHAFVNAMDDEHPLFRVILWQCLFTFVYPRAITFSDPPVHFISHWPAKTHPQIHQLWEDRHLFFIVICSSCVELFDRKIAGIDQKNRKRSRQRWGVFSW